MADINLSVNNQVPVIAKVYPAGSGSGGSATTTTFSVISEATTNLAPGSYIIDATAGSFTITLAQGSGTWEFSDSRMTTTDNPVNIGTPLQTFTTASGTQDAGSYVINYDGAHLKVANVGTPDEFLIVHEPDQIDNHVIIPATSAVTSATEGQTLQANVDGDFVPVDVATLTAGVDTGYEFTGGFTDRTTGQAGANDLGSNVQYTQTMATNDTWYRFGFDATRQAANDVAYFPVTDPTFDQTKGLFGGIHMPEGVNNLIDFTDTSFEDASTATFAAGGSTSISMTNATGSYDLTDCNVGDLVKVRFSFNAVPQVANSTLEVGLIFATRNADDEITFVFPLTTQPIYYGTGTQGIGFLNRVEMSAYIASTEDINARFLPAIRCNNEILIQPLTTLISIVR